VGAHTARHNGVDWHRDAQLGREEGGSEHQEVIRAHAEGGIVTQPFVTVSLPFRKRLDACHFIEANRDRVMKVMIDLDR
jgi:hypothetical protein